MERPKLLALLWCGSWRDRIRSISLSICKVLPVVSTYNSSFPDRLGRVSQFCHDDVGRSGFPQIHDSWINFTNYVFGRHGLWPSLSTPLGPGCSVPVPCPLVLTTVAHLKGFEAGSFSCRPTNSTRAVKAMWNH